MAPRVSRLEAAALKELSERDNLALRVFRPQAHQDSFFTGAKQYTLLLGGNRCNTASTEVRLYTERGEIPVQMKDLCVGDFISGFSETQLKKTIAKTQVVSKTEFTEEAFELTTKRGYKLEGTCDHPVLACPPTARGWHGGVVEDFKKSQWVMLSDLQPGWYVKLAFGDGVEWSGDLDEEAYIHGVMDGDGSCECYAYGVMKLTGHQDESLVPRMQEHLASRGIHSRIYRKTKDGMGISLEWCNKAYKENYRSWSPAWTKAEMAGYICGLMDADGCVSKEGKVILIQKDRERIHNVHRWLLHFGIKSSLYEIAAKPHQNRPNATWRLVISGSNLRRYHRSIGFREEAKIEKLNATHDTKRQVAGGRQWWDRVRCVESVGKKPIVAISTDTETYISNGIMSHNSGKSTCAAAYFAATVLDIPITLSTGEQFRTRHPDQIGKPLKFYCVGINSRHVGETIHRLLFRAGLFRVVYDPSTKELRAYNEDTDRANGLSPKMSPPLIPSRFIESFSWDDKANNVFTKCVVKGLDGRVSAEILAYTSSGKPPQGTPVSGIIWIDEQLPVDGYSSEMSARLVDYAESGAKIIWSSWPDETSTELERFTQVIERNIEEGTGAAARFTLAMSQNKSLGKKAISAFLAGCATQEERDARDKGLFVTERLRMYPNFDKRIHTAIIDDDEMEDALSATLRMTDGVPPDSWTKTLIVDPGTAHPAVLMCAVPPPEFGDYMVAYQEVYPGRADPVQLARATMPLATGQRFYRFIIDRRAGRQQTMGMSYGTRVVDAYTNAFAICKLSCKCTGSQFSFASDDVGGRQSVLLSWLYPGKSPLPKLRIVTHRCPQLVDQMSKVRKKVIAKEEVDERKAKGAYDIVDALEYFAASNPRYVPQTISTQDGSLAYQRYMKKFGNKTARPVVTFGVH